MSKITRQVQNGIEYHYDPEGRLHNVDDKPAKVDRTSKQWFQHGVLHRDGGKPAFENDEVGEVAYFVNGALHREDGPAHTREGRFEKWYRHGLLHNLNGPAVVEFSNIGPAYTYYINGRLVTEYEWKTTKDTLPDGVPPETDPLGLAQVLQGRLLQPRADWTAEVSEVETKPEETEKAGLTEEEVAAQKAADAEAAQKAADKVAAREAAAAKKAADKAEADKAAADKEAKRLAKLAAKEAAKKDADKA